MENDPVTIIVKAPNQQVEDIHIQCEVSWTIKRLKGYLSEVYPSKPSSDEQKLIYSGQLLNDTVVLKDVLRQYDGQDTHTVHLVFTPKNKVIETKKSKEAPRQTTSTLPPTIVITPSTDGLRQRNILNSNGTSSGNPMTNAYSQIQSSVGQMPQNLTAGVPYNAQAHSYEYIMAQQLAMQQFYMQYMNQYMNVVQQGYNGSTSQTQRTNNVPQMPFFASPMMGVNNNVAAQIAAQPQMQQQPLAQPPPPQQQPQPAPIVQQAENNLPDEAERLDWLDMFYVFTRLMVLMTLVYFYTSPVRFTVVIFVTVLYYLYHIGFFRQGNQEPNNNNNNVNNNRLLPNEPNINQNNNNNQPEQPEQQQQEANEADNVTPAAAEANVAAANANPSRDTSAVSAASSSSSSSLSDADGTHEQNNRIPVIALLRTFVLSFFASLIPETPAL